MAESCSDQMDDLLPAYALEALDDSERALVEEHLRGCVMCRRMLAEYQGVANELLAAVPQVKAPSALRDAMQRRLRAAGAGMRPRERAAVRVGAGAARAWTLAAGIALLLLFVL